MTAYDVFLKTSLRGRQRAGLTVHGPDRTTAAGTAALIFDVPADCIILEALR